MWVLRDGLVRVVAVGRRRGRQDLQNQGVGAVSNETGTLENTNSLESRAIAWAREEILSSDG